MKRDRRSINLGNFSPRGCASAFALFACACGTVSTDSNAVGGAGSGGHAGTSGGSLGGGSAGQATSGSAGMAGGGGPAGAAGAPSGGTSGVVASGGAGGAASGGGSSGSSSGSGGSGGTSGSSGGTSGASGSSGDGGSSGSSGAAGASGSDAGGATIVNDRFWTDTSGAPICSQGGGVLQVGDTFYWYGVKYRGCEAYVENLVDNDDTTFEGITTYSSKDLVNWQHEATDRPANIGGWFGRLGVAYNTNTEKYVLVAQSNSNLYFATSDQPNGGFVYSNVQMNPPGIANGGTGDQTVFQDDDGKAYLVSSSREGRSNRYISALRESDFLAAENANLVYRGNGREGNCMFKHAGHYYYCSSLLYGWNSSPAYCVSAPNIDGPWSEEFVLDGTQADYSHVTQTGFFIAVTGSQQTTIVFAGDRWADFAGNGLGFNQWMPLSFEGTTPRFHSLSAWKLNATTGAWSVASGNNWIQNPSFEADRVSVTTPVGWTSTNGANSRDRHSGGWAWQLTGTGSVGRSIANLPNGRYTLAVWSKGGAARLYVKNHGAAEQTVTIPASAGWAETTLADIDVTTGEAEVGVTSTASVIVDDFTLNTR